MDLSIQKKNIIRYGGIAIFLTIAIFFVRREYSLLGVSDAFAISGLMFMIMALFRTAKYMRFYDLPIYGFKKFVEIWKIKEPSKKNSKLGNYGDFIQNYKHERNYMEAYFLAAVMLLIAFVVGSFV